MVVSSHATVRYVPLRVAFLLQDLQLRAGVGAVVAHAAATPGAAIVLTREQEHRHWPYPGLASVPILPFASAVSQDWDVAVASGGATVSPLLDLRATRHACLLVEADSVDGVSATALPLRFLAPTRATAALIDDLQPGNAALHVPRGQTPIGSEGANRGQTPRVLTVGEGAYASHDELVEAVAASDVVVALDDADDPYDTVLVAVALGVPVVATAVPGRDEVVVHGNNGLLVDDALGAAAAVERAARLTPRPAAAPSGIVAALRRVLDEPPPPARAVARRVAADLATAHGEAEALRHRLAHAASPPPPAAVAPSSLRRVARAAKRRLRR
jgi:glycosyltransferase involved in cell wall biosynthesis